MRLNVSLHKTIIGAVGLSLVLLGGGCTRRPAQASAKRTVIQNIGSDTMVNLAQAWAEEYALVNTGISVEVSGGGTGTGVEHATTQQLFEHPLKQQTADYLAVRFG